jgi:magnesium-transporting ATPase (P-type)
MPSPNELPGYTVDGDKTLFNTYSANMEIQYTNNYHAQNEMLKKLKDQQSTRDSKSAYLKEQTYSLNWYNWIFLWVYVAFGFLFIVFCFIGKKTANWSVATKILIASIVILFPIFINPLERSLLDLYSFIVNLITGSAYISPSY